MSMTRREFLTGCSAAIAAMTGGRITELVFADSRHPYHAYQTSGTQPAASGEIFVMVFLRGACDGLSLVSPYDDPIYQQDRGNIALPDPSRTTTNAAIKIDPQNSTFTSSVGLHPSAAPLKELYDAKNLAFVHACGLDDETRSHFDAMDYIERGTPGNKSTASGWLARHAQCVQLGGTVSTLAAASAAPTSLLTDNDAVAMTNVNSYGLSAAYTYNNSTNPAMLTSLKKFYTGTGTFQAAGQRVIETIDTIQNLKNANGGKNLTYTPEAGVTYPSNSFGSSLQLIAQMIKLDLGLQIATVDFGGWDTHENQGVNGGYYASQVDTLARGLNAFYNDLPNHTGKLTVAVMSEFGRRLGANASSGTDHGHGNVMTILGGNVNGGKVYGTWPGLADLDQQEDLKITTDFRSILGEIVVNRLGNSKLGAVFPGLTADIYKPLSVVQGSPTGPLDFNPDVSMQQGKIFLPLMRGS